MYYILGKYPPYAGSVILLTIREGSKIDFESMPRRASFGVWTGTSPLEFLQITTVI